MNEKKVIIKYLLCEEGRKNSIFLGGNGEMVQTIEADVAERILNLSTVDCDGNIYMNIGFKPSSGSSIKNVIVSYIEESDKYGRYLVEESDIKFFDKVSELNELLDWEENRRQSLIQLEERYKPYIEERNKNKQEAKDKENEEYKIRRQKENEEYEIRMKKKNEEDEAYQTKIKNEQEKIDEEKELFIKERNKWINEHGNQYLINAIKLGYDIDSKYAIERAKQELPNFDLDIDDNAGWEEIHNPSEKAIEELVALIENGYEAEIVLLTHSVEENDDDEYYERDEDSDKGCESIVIRSFLGKYDLVKTIYA